MQLVGKLPLRHPDTPTRPWPGLKEHPRNWEASGAPVSIITPPAPQTSHLGMEGTHAPVLITHFKHGDCLKTVPALPVEEALRKV